MISGAEKIEADCARRSPSSAPLDAGSIPAISTSGRSPRSGDASVAGPGTSAFHGSAPSRPRAQPAIFRPEWEIAGGVTRLLVDQIRTIDVSFVQGDPIAHLDRHELAVVEHAVIRYLGL